MPDAAAISGLDYLVAIKEGWILQPPAARLLGYRLCKLERGPAVFELEPAEYHYNPFATVHGGITGTLLDSAITAAVLPTFRIGLTCSTLEVKVSFVRPIAGSVGIVRAEGKVLHLRSSIATAEGRLLDGQGGVDCCACRKQKVGGSGSVRRRRRRSLTRSLPGWSALSRLRVLSWAQGPSSINEPRTSLLTPSP
jgi:uncharacterized protein (TIGR00369 family)